MASHCPNSIFGHSNPLQGQSPISPPIQSPLTLPGCMKRETGEGGSKLDRKWNTVRVKKYIRESQGVGLGPALLNWLFVGKGLIFSRGHFLEL